MKKMVWAIVLCLSTPLALADDFTETIDTAKKLYEEGDLAGVKEEMDYAMQLLAQMRANSLQSFLPEAPEGWTREDVKNNSGAGMAIMGGGTTASFKYKSESGKDKITVSLIADSPMIQGMSMLFSNAALAPSQGTMKRLSRQKVMVKKNGDLSTLINKRIMVEVKGRASEEDKEMFFNEIDFKGLKNY